jgi:putative ABC transport system permease protein
MNLLNKLTIKNLLLNKRRTIVTIIGIMLSVALITAVASVYNSGIESLKNFEIHEVGNYHMIFYNVDANNIEEIKNYRGVEEVLLTKSLGYAKVDSQNDGKPYAHVIGYDKNTMNNLSIQLVEGRLPENDNEVVIPTHLKTNGRLKLNVGDDITLDLGTRTYMDEGNILTQQNEYTEGEVLNVKETKTYKIVGVAERPANKVEPFMAPGYSFITLVKDNVFNGKVDVYVKLDKKNIKDYLKIFANIEGIEERAVELSAKSEKLSKDEEVYVENEFNKAKYPLADMNIYLIKLENDPLGLSSMGGVSYVAAVVIIIIIVTSVFCIKNSFDISITEKIRQYGMLRSIGSTKKQIRKNVFYEATILGLIGIPLGIGLGILASYILIIISNYYLVDMMASNIKLVFA